MIFFFLLLVSFSRFYNCLALLTSLGFMLSFCSSFLSHSLALLLLLCFDSHLRRKKLTNIVDNLRLIIV